MKLVIYDLDGTLLDAFEDIADALNHGLAEFGYPVHPLEAVKKMVGEGIERLVERGLPAGEGHRWPEVLPAVGRYYTEHPSNRARLYPGVPEALAAVRARGLRQAVLTNKPHEIAVDACRDLGLSGAVDIVQGAVRGEPLKPHPAAALALAGRFGATPDECVIVGDGKPDVELARAAGMRVVGCTWGMHSRGEIESLAPDVIIDSMTELGDALDRCARMAAR